MRFAPSHEDNRRHRQQSGSRLSESVIDGTAMDRLRKIGGDSFLKQMIELFLTDAVTKCEAAVNGCREQDWEAVEHAVHSLKSSAGNVGAVELQELSDQIESLIRTNDPETIPALISRLEIVFEQVIVNLKEIRE